MPTSYDAIVVGARCAGLSTAFLLARRGYRVLVVDRAEFPSGTLSGHAIHPAGLATLQRRGILDRVRAAGAPPRGVQHFDVGPIRLTGTPLPVDGISDLCCVRRTCSTPSCSPGPQPLAPKSGSGSRSGTCCGTVTASSGSRGRDAGGTNFAERAQVVVGADEKHSVVARAVEAPTYQDVPALTCNAYSYRSGVDVDAVELYPRDGRFTVAVGTNDGLTIVNSVRSIGEAPTVRADVERSFFEAIAPLGHLEERLKAGRREERFRFTTDLDNFFRRPWGPGWALVGDAGYHKDPLTAQGMTDAFSDAELLAEALDTAFSRGPPILAALSDYERARNAAVGPMYDFTLQLCRLEPPRRSSSSSSPCCRTILRAPPASSACSQARSQSRSSSRPRTWNACSQPEQ